MSIANFNDAISEELGSVLFTIFPKNFFNVIHFVSIFLHILIAKLLRNTFLLFISVVEWFPILNILALCLYSFLIKNIQETIIDLIVGLLVLSLIVSNLA